jgi:hypothetical protein
MTPGGENAFLMARATFLRGAHGRRDGLRRRRENVLAGGFRHDQRMALGLRHDVHEGERVRILIHLVAGDLAADDAGEDVVVVVSHLSAPVRSR